MSGLKRPFQVFVGIDVSKDKFDACGIREDGTKLFQFSATMDRKGAEKLRSHLSFIPIASVLIGMESTASYHVNLFSYLASEGYAVVVINPLLISNYVKMQLRKTKTDKKDAWVIARFLLANRDSMTQRAASPLISDLRELARQRESLVEQMTSLKNDIKRILKLLQRYPSAYAIQEADLDQLTQMLIEDSYGHKRGEFAEALLKAARSSIGTHSPMRDVILKQKISLHLHLEEALQEITEMLLQTSRGMMGDDMDILNSIKGIGEKTAASFLIEMGGDIQQFDQPNKLIAMAGIDPAVHQSGKYEGSSRITKRGNRHLRRIIWLMTTQVIHYCDVFRAYYLKRRKEGLPYKKAVLATSHKLIRVIYALLTQRTVFRQEVNS
jgi:transposase